MIAGPAGDRRSGLAANVDIASPSFGVRLGHAARDVAALETLAREMPGLVEASWVEVTAGGAKTVIVSPRLTQAGARVLAVYGVPAVKATRPFDGKSAVRVETLSETEAETWENAELRAAPSLLEVVRPVYVPGDAVPDEACLVVPAHGPTALQLVERLLALGRDDVRIAEWRHGEERALAVFLAKPPLYLLMRAREGADGVRAFARAHGGDLWVEWGHEHPFAARARVELKGKGRSAFVDKHGRWTFGPAEWPARELLDWVRPVLEAPRTDLVPVSGDLKLPIRLSLGSGPETDPELWFLDADELLALEPFLEVTPAAELSRFTLSRLYEPGGRARYVLREIPRPSSPRFGARVSETLGVPGFSRAQGVDNLYLPAARRLVPAVRRDQLRALLALDDAHAVILIEDGGGLTSIRVPPLEEAPLSKWVEYVATDRRLELDRLLERTVFDFPELVVERPPVKEKVEALDPVEAPKAPREASGPRAPATATRSRPERPARPEPDGSAHMALDEARELRERIRAIEGEVLEGGASDAPLWRELGELHLRLDERDDGAACLESALFFGEAAGRDGGLAATLAEARRGGKPGVASADELLAIALDEHASPGALAFLGAALSAELLSKRPINEDLVHHTARLFLRPDLPVSRRLAWIVLSLAHRRSSDTLGLTRAKETFLGAINTGGLSEVYDVPRFVRLSLALADDPEGTARDAAGQVLVLERLWRTLASQHVTELDGASAFYRAIFAIGFARAGAMSRARDLTAPIEEELPVHDAPNRVLLGLYLAYLGHTATKGEPEAWRAHVAQTMEQVRDRAVSVPVEFLLKRSQWLGKGARPEPPTAWLRPEVERAIVAVVDSPASAPDGIAAISKKSKLFDYEVAAAMKRMLIAVSSTGDDDLTTRALDAAVEALPRIGIASWRAQAIASCIRAAGIIGDLGRVDRLLDALILAAQGRTEPGGARGSDVPQIRDLIEATNPALAALRRLGIGASAHRFLEELEQTAQRAGGEHVRLLAAIADGLFQLREVEHADRVLDAAMDLVLGGTLDYVARYDGADAILSTLMHRPPDTRQLHAERLIRGFTHFKDTFTVSVHYPAHKVLLLEKMMTTLADTLAFRRDRLERYLEAEEHALRRAVLNDWSRACGR